jgi:hypothetical protein
VEAEKMMFQLKGIMIFLKQIAGIVGVTIAFVLLLPGFEQGVDSRRRSTSFCMEVERKSKNQINQSKK